MFTHYPPPEKFEKPPRDLLEYLQRHNKKMMEEGKGNTRWTLYRKLMEGWAMDREKIKNF